MAIFGWLAHGRRPRACGAPSDSLRSACGAPAERLRSVTVSGLWSALAAGLATPKGRAGRRRTLARVRDAGPSLSPSSRRTRAVVGPVSLRPSSAETPLDSGGGAQPWCTCTRTPSELLAAFATRPPARGHRLRDAHDTYTRHAAPTAPHELDPTKEFLLYLGFLEGLQRCRRPPCHAARLGWFESEHVDRRPHR